MVELCMEVIEHEVNVFECSKEFFSFLVDSGFLVLSTSLNARIYGPVLDCWRFTKFGLNVLLRNFDIDTLMFGLQNSKKILIQEKLSLIMLIDECIERV